MANDRQKFSDLELVQQTKAGDTEAYSELMRRHQQVIYNLCYRFMRDSSQAEDMSQEAFLKGYRLLHGFRGDCTFSTWLYRVAGSVCLTEIARRKRRGETALLPQHMEQVLAPQAEPSDMPEKIRGCVSQLSQRYATIITMYYLKGLPYEEIAQVLNIPMGTLKTWMFRARKQLRKVLETELAGNAP